MVRFPEGLNRTVRKTIAGAIDTDHGIIGLLPVSGRQLFKEQSFCEGKWAGFVEAANPCPAGPGRYPVTSYPVGFKRPFSRLTVSSVTLMPKLPYVCGNGHPPSDANARSFPTQASDRSCGGPVALRDRSRPTPGAKSAGSAAGPSTLEKFLPPSAAQESGSQGRLTNLLDPFI